MALTLQTQAMLKLPLEDIIRMSDVIPISDEAAREILFRVYPFAEKDLVDANYNKIGWNEFIKDLVFIYKSRATPLIINNEHPFYWNYRDGEYITIYDRFFEAISNFDYIVANIITQAYDIVHCSNVAGTIRDKIKASAYSFTPEAREILQVMADKQSSFISKTLLRLVNEKIELYDQELEFAPSPYMHTLFVTVHGLDDGILVIGSVKRTEDSFEPLAHKIVGEDAKLFLGILGYNQDSIRIESY